MARISDITAVILAGGASRRMGTDKAMLDFNGCPLLSLIVEYMECMFEKVLIAGGDPQRYADQAVPVVPDLFDGKGAIVGIHAGLSAATTDRIFAIACDSPYPCADLIRKLIDIDREAAWVVPRTELGLEPLFSIYHKSCLPALEQIIAENKRRISLLGGMVPTCYVGEAILRSIDPELRSFVNVNTPEDLANLGEFKNNPCAS